MATYEGVFKGSIQKHIRPSDLEVVSTRITESGSEERIWGLPESEIPRTWESWLITTLPDNPDWTAAIRLEPDAAGEFVAAELRVFPTESHDGDPDEDPRIQGLWSGNLDAIPDGGIRVRDLRGLQLAHHVREGRAAATNAVSAKADELRTHTDRLGRVVDPKMLAWLDALPPPPAASSGRGKRIPDLAYIHVAAIYVHHCDAGSKRPAADTAAELGDAWTNEKVRDWLRRARRRQLLTRSGHGKSGGRLTAEARRILRDAQTASPTGG